VINELKSDAGKLQQEKGGNSSTPVSVKKKLPSDVSVSFN